MSLVEYKSTISLFVFHQLQYHMCLIYFILLFYKERKITYGIVQLVEHKAKHNKWD